MKALIVDEQNDATQLLIASVEWKKLSIDCIFLAYSTNKAKVVMEKENIDILLCNIQTPSSSGFDFVHWAQQRRHNLIVVFLSPYAAFEYARKAVALDSQDHIHQSAAKKEIVKEIERAIGRAHNTKKSLTHQPLSSDSEAMPTFFKGEDEPVEIAKEYINKHLDQDISRSEIARLLHLNPEYLSHLFKRKTGIPLCKYIISEKMKAACSLLENSDLKVSIVASKVGFVNYSYFSHVFKRNVGLSPLEYRAQKRKV